MKISELEEAVRESNVKELLLRTKIANSRTLSQSGITILNDDTSETSSSTAPTNNLETCCNESLLVSLSTAFLVIHPNGAEIESLFSYVQQFAESTSRNELQEVLVKNEKLFSEDGSKWLYTGFMKMPIK